MTNRRVRLEHGAAISIVALADQTFALKNSISYRKLGIDFRVSTDTPVVAKTIWDDDFLVELVSRVLNQTSAGRFIVRTRPIIVDHFVLEVSVPSCYTLRYDLNCVIL